jgi:hypothetical protein
MDFFRLIELDWIFCHMSLIGFLLPRQIRTHIHVLKYDDIEIRSQGTEIHLKSSNFISRSEIEFEI